jgi:integrase
MPKRITPLSEVKVRNAKPMNNPHKLFDGGGLFLLVTPSGGKLWHFKYRFEKKEKKLAFGTYPEISLADARQRREEARQQLAHGIDPGTVKKAKQQAAIAETETFEVIAREWHNRQSSVWVPAYADKMIKSLERSIFPWMGQRPINEIKAQELLMVLRKIEAKGTLDTAHRMRFVCGQVFRYAIATGRAERDLATDLRGALTPFKEKNHAAITDPVKVGGLLRAIDGYDGHFVVQCALCLAPLVFVRPGELRQAEWAEINLDEAAWNIPAEKMKMKQPHLVPLSSQAVEILKGLLPLTGRSRYVFPSARSSARPMSNNAILAALRRMGFDKDEMSGHGFRAMARTILDEVLQVRPDFIEHQLAHAVRDPNGRAYNRTAHLEERRKMMQKWSDYLDKLKAGAVVIPFQTAKG